MSGNQVDRLKKLIGVELDIELAEQLDVDVEIVAGWKKRNKVPPSSFAKAMEIVGHSCDIEIEQLKELTNTKRDVELAETLGLAKNTVSNWRARGVVPRKYINMIYSGEVPISTDEVTSVSIRLYDVIASAGAGALVEYEPVREIELSESLQMVLGITNPGKARMLYMQGDSMTPTLQDGSLIAIESIDNFVNDGIYVFNWEGELFIKRLQRIKDGVRVMSDNNKYEAWEITRDEMQDRHFVILGRVTGCCQRL
ncbi:LexA family transcriptional regulator [Vibrio harveyi]|uniref:LexA family transcriptional regulator n=1 Tax=Vibrio harveyi TaxID=669 RepID=UPI003BB7F102